MRDRQIKRRSRDWTIDVGLFIAVYSREFFLSCTIAVFESLLGQLDKIVACQQGGLSSEMSREVNVDVLNREILFRERMAKAFPGAGFNLEIDDD